MPKFQPDDDLVFVEQGRDNAKAVVVWMAGAIWFIVVVLICWIINLFF
jgi:hypothetical protein